jgi:hypothetical protein
MKEISKNLLRKIYPVGANVDYYVGIQVETNRIMKFGKQYNEPRSEINIFEVAHKFKEWAESK